MKWTKWFIGAAILVALACWIAAPAQGATKPITKNVQTKYVTSVSALETESLPIKFLYVVSPGGRVMLESVLVGDVSRTGDTLEWFDTDHVFHRQYLVDGVTIHIADRPMSWKGRAKRTLD